jgi:Flp pilus assembly protein TadG
MERQGFKLINLLRRMRRDERGAIWLQAIFVLLATFAFAGLSIDAARYYMLNSDLQDMADAAALAGAKELDGASDAIDRATSAAQTYFNDHACPYSTGLPATGNCARWWDTSGVAFNAPIFYEDPLTQTTDPAKAAYIRVTTGSSWGVTPTLLTAVGITSANNTMASAVAGSTFIACNVQPLMLCNPKETVSSHPDFTATPGDIFGFTANGSTGGYSPGDFGLLDPPGQHNAGSPEIAALLSQSNPNICYVNSLSPDQGQKTSAVADGINVRFDINPNGNPPSGMDTTPAANVVKGYTPASNGNGNVNGNGNGNGGGNTCLKTNDVKNLTPAAQLPINTGTSQVGSTYVGGTVDPAGKISYWTAHHDKTGATSWPSGVTRYQMYQNELAAATGSAYSFANGSSTEVMAPTCGSPTNDPARRIISAAVVNCISQGINGNSNANVRATSYSEFFIIRPVDQTGIIWTEYIRTVTPTSSGSKLHQVIRLYNGGSTRFQ